MPRDQIRGRAAQSGRVLLVTALMLLLQVYSEDYKVVRIRGTIPHAAGGLAAASAASLLYNRSVGACSREGEPPHACNTSTAIENTPAPSTSPSPATRLKQVMTSWNFGTSNSCISPNKAAGFTPARKCDTATVLMLTKFANRYGTRRYARAVAKFGSKNCGCLTLGRIAASEGHTYLQHPNTSKPIIPKHIF